MERKLERLSLGRKGPVALLYLNRPEVRNALDPKALAELAGILKLLGRDRSVRAAVVAGRGPDFCAGADISWMRAAADHGAAKGEKDARLLLEACQALDEVPFLVIGRVQGNCFGGGLGLAAACDVVFAADNARFCFSEGRLGLLPAVVSTFVLPKIGLGEARRLYLTGEVFDGEEARRIGLAHKVCPEPELDGAIDELLEKALALGPQAVRTGKAYLRTMEGLSRPGRMRYSVKVLAKVRSGDEAKEGFSAFLEKRKPKWAASG